MKAIQRKAAARAFRLAGLRLVREGGYNVEVIERAPMHSPREVFRTMEPFAQQEEAEVFWVLSLDSQNRLIPTRDPATGERVVGPQVVTRGILNSSLVHPREVFRNAIAQGAAAIILCHNHPSGDPAPSADDRSVTDQLVAAGRLLDIPVHDHIVCGRGRYVSFAETGLL